MENRGGDLAAKRAKIADAGEDRLNALPDDILILILLRLPTSAAAQTSLISRRWRHVWTLLPELTFTSFPDPLRYLFVTDSNHRVAPLAVWLPAAARRVSGLFTLFNADLLRRTEEEETLAQLSCPASRRPPRSGSA